MQTGKYTFGFDVGVASCGWSVIDIVDGREVFIDMGVRIFSEPRDPENRRPLSQDRRRARSMRRLISRRKMRKLAVLRLVRENNMDGNESVRMVSPWQLRAEALDRELTLEEFGRIMIHMAKKRGFRSNRKIDTREDAAPEKKTTNAKRQEA